MAGLIAETTFYEDPKNPAPDADQGGVNVHEHAKKLCVNKLGHTMVVPPKEGTSRVKFGELFKRYRLRTICYCSVFWSFGMCVAFLGPTLLDLECRLESLLSTMSWIFFSQALFTLIGAACGGFLAQKCCHSILLLVSSIMICITLSIIPLCTVLFWLSIVLAFMGFFMGTIDTVANIAMIELYGRNVAPFLQALHFCYGLGAFVSPLVAKPFLLNKDCSELVQAASLLNVTLPKHNLHLMSKANLTDPFQEISYAQKNSNIENAFWILAAMQIPVIIILSVLVVKDFYGYNNQYDFNTPGFVETKEGIEMNRASISRNSIIPADASEDRPMASKKQLILLVGSTVAILFIYDGLQAGFGDYIYSYSVKNVDNMPNDEAAYLNSCFWGMFAFGRLMSIGIATKLTPAFMLSINIIGCLFSIILLLFFLHSRHVIYIGTSLFAMFLSSVYPTSVTLAETYINVTSFIASILVLAAASGEMMMPVIFGYEFDGIGPVSLLISSLIMILLSCFFYVLVNVVGDSILRQSSNSSVIQRIKNLLIPPNADEEVTEGSGLLSHHVKYYKRMRSEPSESDLRTSPTMIKSPIVGNGSSEAAQINGVVTTSTG
ncbi:UNVERIFIED_CONTAM: hypothetical protein RMT77_008547 [Armadillidium vulgare]